jgi:hypothetical protein
MTGSGRRDAVLGAVRVLAKGTTLRPNGFDAREARIAREVLLLVSESHHSVLVTDLDLPAGDRRALIRQARGRLGHRDLLVQ